MQLNYYITEISNRGQNTCCTGVIQKNRQNSEAYIVIFLQHKSSTIPGFGDVIQVCLEHIRSFIWLVTNKSHFYHDPPKFFQDFFNDISHLNVKFQKLNLPDQGISVNNSWHYERAIFQTLPFTGLHNVASRHLNYVMQQ